MRLPVRTLHLLAKGAMAALSIWGLIIALLPLQPFWIDEWRLIYNLKFRSFNGLWQPLSYTQQFPRLYLAALKAVTGAFHYSYPALRLPALCVSVATMLLIWRLMRRVFPQPGEPLRPLFVLIIISAQTFTSYLVQTKHYEMEILLAALALWQALELHLLRNGQASGWRYAALCLTMGFAPFFSYTYPIAAAPLYLLSVAPAIRLARTREYRRLTGLCLPLLTGLCGILVFYITDVRQLMHDEAMHRYWAYRMASGSPLIRFQNVWAFFATVGSGAVFEIIFGLLGITALIVSLRSQPASSNVDPALTYASTLLLVVLSVFFAGRLPLGEAKFSAFCVPAQAVLIVKLLQRLRGRLPKMATIISGILYAGLLGNIASVIYTLHYAPEYSRRMTIYRNTEAAIHTAQRLNAAILVTPGVAWPDQIVHKVPFLENMPADAILKTFPAYDAAGRIAVYAIGDTAGALPEGVQMAVTGDGMNYRIKNGRR